MVDETSLKYKLLEDDLVEEDLVDAAQDRESVYGGDLASQLLIMKAIDERDLLEALAETKGVDAADPDDYNRIDPDALMTIERPLLLEYKIIPFQKHRHNLGVFVVEPLDDDAITRLSETHGVRITQYIWPRIRFHQTLAALMDQPLPDWAEGFDDGVELSFAEDFEFPEGSDDLAQNSSPAIGRPVSDPHMEPDEVEFSELGIGWSCEQMLDFVGKCYNRDAVLYALLGYADWWLEHRMVLVLGKDSIQPYLIAGWSELPDEFRNVERLRQLRVPVDPSAPIFDQEQVGHFLADKPEDVGLGDLFVELTLFPPDRLLNQSVKIGNRPYMLLVGEPRSGMPSVPPGIDRLEEVAVKVGKQLETIIRATKTDGLPPEGERIPALPNPEGQFDEEVGEPEELDEQDEPEEVEEPPVTPEVDVEESAPSGRTLDGTGASYVELKDEVDDGEMSAPQLGGQSEPENARQTQHISKEESESLAEISEEVSAPQLEGKTGDARQTQAMPPGMQESSSVAEEPASEPELEQPDDVASTSFGIPFADSEEEESEPEEAEDDPSSTTFGFGFVDDEDAEEDEEAEEEALEEEESESEPVEVDEIDEPRKDPSLPEFDVENSNSTMMGGFEVTDSQSSYAEQVKRRDEEEEQEDDDFDDDDYFDDDGPSLESLDGGTSFAEESSAAKDIPEAKIVNFVSLAKGRRSLQESSADEESESEAIPKIEPSSEDLDSGSIAFTDEDLEETADLLDSRNPANAFNAAEQIVEWGGKAVQELRKRFPGRLFVDRHEYTSGTLPPVEEHGPVISALAKLEDRAVSVVEDHLEDSSVELRFYATLLFKELPIDSVTDKLVERLFDRDAMIRDIAADILVNRTDEDFKQDSLLPRLRDEVEIARDKIHVEVAARLLGRMKDRYAVPTLIEALEDASGHVQQTIQGALAGITYKKLSPSVSEWRNWWASAHEKSREDWIVDALNHDSEDVRRLVHFELKKWDDLDLDYDPDQPKKLRMRAQEQLREWFDERD